MRRQPLRLRRKSPSAQARSDNRAARDHAASAAAEPGAPAAAKKPPKPKPAAAAAAALPAAVAAGAKPTLLGRCASRVLTRRRPAARRFALLSPSPRPRNHPAGRPRNPTYIFISSRPADKVSNEVSIIIGYPFKSSADATVEVGATSFALLPSRTAPGSRTGQTKLGWSRPCAGRARLLGYFGPRARRRPTRSP